MNEPFLLSNLIDLQDIDNEITKLITKKSEGKTVLELKKLEQKYKEVTKAIAISKEAMGDYFSDKKAENLWENILQIDIESGFKELLNLLDND